MLNVAFYTFFLALPLSLVSDDKKKAPRWVTPELRDSQMRPRASNLSIADDPYCNKKV